MNGEALRNTGGDRRDPEVITDLTGRKCVIDQAVLDPMRGVMPSDEPYETERDPGDEHHGARIQIGPTDV